MNFELTQAFKSALSSRMFTLKIWDTCSVAGWPERTNLAGPFIWPILLIIRIIIIYTSLSHWRFTFHIFHDSILVEDKKNDLVLSILWLYQLISLWSRATNKQFDHLIVSNRRYPWTPATPEELRLLYRPFGD